MLLTVDVGNTQTHLGLFSDQELKGCLAFRHRTRQDWRRAGGHGGRSAAP